MTQFRKKAIIYILLTGMFACTGMAQCRHDNKAFQAGESLVYDLYFNWKFIWVKAGTTYFDIKNTQYAGQKALRTDILFQSNKTCSRYFPMRDTLISITTQDLKPLYFRKGALEGKQYTVNEVWYTYSNGQAHLRQKFLDRNGEWSSRQTDCNECINDMLSILADARCTDYSKYKEGRRINFQMASGKRLSNQILIYRGIKNFKANDDKTYRCLVFSVLDEHEKKKEKELMRFFITDDANHLPVRIDFFLKFGIAKAYYVSGKGIRNPQTAIVQKKTKNNK